MKKLKIETIGYAFSVFVFASGMIGIAWVIEYPPGFSLALELIGGGLTLTVGSLLSMHVFGFNLFVEPEKPKPMQLIDRINMLYRDKWKLEHIPSEGYYFDSGTQKIFNETIEGMENFLINNKVGKFNTIDSLNEIQAKLFTSGKYDLVEQIDLIKKQISKNH